MSSGVWPFNSALSSFCRAPSHRTGFSTCGQPNAGARDREQISQVGSQAVAPGVHSEGAQRAPGALQRSGHGWQRPRATTSTREEASVAEEARRAFRCAAMLRIAGRLPRSRCEKARQRSVSMKRVPCVVMSSRMAANRSFVSWSLAATCAGSKHAPLSVAEGSRSASGSDNAASLLHSDAAGNPPERCPRSS